MTNPPDDEGLRLVRRDEPEPRLLYTAVSKPEPQKPEKETQGPALADGSTFFSLGRIIIIVARRNRPSFQRRRPSRAETIPRVHRDETRNAASRTRA